MNCDGRLGRKDLTGEENRDADGTGGPEGGEEDWRERVEGSSRVTRFRQDLYKYQTRTWIKTSREKRETRTLDI